MAKVLANVLAGGGDASGVWVAPKGTTGPTGIAAPTATYKEAGWLSEDGISVGRSEDRKTLRAHQGGKIIKRKTASIDDTIKFQCLETNAVTVGLWFKGATPVVASGVATYTVANQTINDERAWVVDEYMDDGSVERYVIPNGSVEGGEVVYKTDDWTVREFTIGINGDYFYITNVPGVATPA